MLASEGPHASAVGGALALFLPAPFLERLLVTRPSGGLASQAAAVVALLGAQHATPEVSGLASNQLVCVCFIFIFFLLTLVGF